MLEGLRTVVYLVDDLAAARDWYARALDRAPYFDEPFYVGFDLGGYELGLHPAGDDGPRPGVGGALAYWGVPDAGQALTRLEALGATVLQPAQDVGGGIVVASVRDPFGNALGVITNPHFAPPLTAAGAGELAAQDIALEVDVPVSPEVAWAAWTSTEGLGAWWLPTTRIALRPGGFYELYFLTDAPAGLQGSETCRVLSYLPARMLSFTWNSPPHLPKTRRQHTWVVLEFAPTPDGAGTHVRLTHTGWPAAGMADPESQWPATFAYFERAWGQVMRLFTTHFGA